MTAPTAPEKRAAIREMHAAGFTTRQVSRSLKCSYQTIRRALDLDAPVSKFAPKVMPADFAVRAAAMTFSEAACAFGVSGTTVFHWASKCGIKFVSGVRPVPDDFEARYRVTTKRVLEAHYQASYSTVKRWGSKMPADARAEHDAFVRAAIGDGARERWAVVNAAKPPKPVKVKRQAPGAGVRWGSARALPVPEAKADIISLVMRHLQRAGYAPVCRAETFYSDKCKAAGAAAAGLFRVCSRNITESELMQLAARKGFTVSEGFAG